MITAVRRVQFCAGHRVLGHEGPCGQFHGHNYVVFFHAAAEALDDLGMVVDFNVLKVRLGGWIQQHWDHGFICHHRDEAARQALAAISGQKLFLLEANPTAENMARYLLEKVGPQQLGGTGVQLVRVILWETENCHVEVDLRPSVVADRGVLSGPTEPERLSDNSASPG